MPRLEIKSVEGFCIKDFYVFHTIAAFRHWMLNYCDEKIGMIAQNRSKPKTIYFFYIKKGLTSYQSITKQSVFHF